MSPSHTTCCKRRICVVAQSVDCAPHHMGPMSKKAKKRAARAADASVPPAPDELASLRELNKNLMDQIKELTLTIKEMRDAQRKQTAQIEILKICRGGLHDDLKLIVVLQAIGIFTVTAICRPSARLHVGRVPVFRP